jgi:hypothetical protein
MILKKTKAILLIVMAISIAACAQTTQMPTPTQPVAETMTPPSADATGGECDPDQIIVRLRENLPYEEVAVSHNILDKTRNLTVWFVDPGLVQTAEMGDAESMAELAIEHSIQLAHWIHRSDTCVAGSFDSLTLIAVDQAYDAWYVGSVPPYRLPDQESLSDADMLKLKSFFIEGYRRDELAARDDQPLPDEACDWRAARSALQSIFVKARINVSFFYYVDQDGGEIWAQWDVPPWVLSSGDILSGFIDPLLEVDQALTCMYPPFETLWVTYVQPDGTVELAAAINGEAIRDEDHEVMLDRIELIYARSE